MSVLLESLGWIGDLEPTQTVFSRFRTLEDAEGPVTLNFEKVSGGVDPLFKVVKGSGTYASKTAIGVSVTVNEVNGVHKVVIDTTDVFYTGGQDYHLIVDDGRIQKTDTTWVDVTNEEILSFSIANRSDGFVLDRSHKIFDGTVSSVTDATKFRITGSGINATAVDYYVGQILSFQAPAVNASLDGVVAESVIIDASTVELLMQRPFPIVPVVGDAFDVLHSLPESSFTANIVLRAGSGVNSDAITVRWQRDRERIPNIATVMPKGTLTVYQLTQLQNPQRQVSTFIETITDQDIDPLTGLHLFALTTNQSLVGQGLVMECSALYVPTNRIVTDSRIMYVSR